MKILYLHGLLGKLKEAKRQVLENHGQVVAPDIDYHNNPDAIETLVALYGARPYSRVAELESPVTRRAKPRKAQFTAVNEHFEGEHNEVNGLYRQSPYSNAKIDVVIGSSMGGFAGWHVSRALAVPALLFNPALAERSVQQNIPEYPFSRLNYKQLVIGAADDVVDPTGTLAYIGKHLEDLPDTSIRIRQHLTHRIPVDVFDEEVGRFFGSRTSAH